jgi:hypothetical protein
VKKEFTTGEFLRVGSQTFGGQAGLENFVFGPAIYAPSELNLVAAGFCKLFSARSAVNLYFVIPEFIWKIAKEKNRMKTGPKAYNPGGEK